MTLLNTTNKNVLDNNIGILTKIKYFATMKIYYKYSK